MPAAELPADFEQTIGVVEKRVHGNVRRYYFVCPECAQAREKVFLYVPIRTMIEEVLQKKWQSGKVAEGQSGRQKRPGNRQFLCRQCLGLRYESEEASEKGSNLMRRWFLRMSGGLFTEREFFEFAQGK
jgi:hypothetical protein